MTPAQVLTYFGGIAETVAAVRVTEDAISGWIKTGYIPLCTQRIIEGITSCDLLAEAQHAGRVPTNDELIRLQGIKNSIAYHFRREREEARKT